MGITGVVGGALTALVAVEAITLVTLVSLPVAYGLSRIEDEQTWRNVFPFAAGGIAALFMQSRLVIPELKGTALLIAFINMFEVRVICQVGACDYWFVFRLLVAILFGIAVGIAVQLIPCPLPPHFSFNTPSGLRRARQLQAAADEQAALLLSLLPEVAVNSDDKAVATVQNLCFSIGETLGQLAEMLKPASVELHFLGRGPDAKVLIGGLVRAKSQHALLSTAVDVVVSVHAAPLVGCERTSAATHRLAAALNADGRTPAQLRAAVVELAAAYASERGSVAASGATRLWFADTFVWSVVRLAQGYTANCEAAAAAAAAAKSAGWKEALLSYRLFSPTWQNWRTPFHPLWKGPVSSISSWQPTIMSIKSAIAMGSVSLWVTVPALVDRGDGHGMWVVMNYILVMGESLIKGRGGSWKRAFDRLAGNGLVCMFVLILVTILEVSENRQMVPIGVAWVMFTLFLRSPEMLYRWTNAAYTYNIVVWGLNESTRTFELTSEYVALRVSMTLIGLLYWVAFEFIFSVLELTDTYRSASASNARAILDHYQHTTALLSTAETALSNPNTPVRAVTDDDATADATADAKAKADADADCAAEVAAALTAQLAATKGATASARTSLEHASHEPDVGGLNFPRPNAASRSCISRFDDVDALLAALVDCVKSCRSADAVALAGFVGPVARKLADCVEIYRQYRDTEPTAWLGAFSGFRMLTEKVRKSAEEYHRQLQVSPVKEGTDADADEAAALVSQVGVGGGAWAMWQFCKLTVVDAEAAAQLASTWAAWKKTLRSEAATVEEEKQPLI